MSFKGTLALKPIVSEVARLNDWLDGAFSRSGVQSSIATDFKLCLNEIVINLISYAFAQTTEPCIIVEIELQALVAKAEVRDNGTDFDIRDWPAPPAPKDVMSAQIGGYGILLDRDRASTIDDDRVDSVNRLRITCSGGSFAAAQQDQ